MRAIEKWGRADIEGEPTRRRVAPTISRLGRASPAVPTMTPMARFTMPETLPEGEEKVEAVRSMFDAIAPRYDLVNRIMTFRMDVGWRRQTVREPRPARRRRRCSTWRAAPATCAASWPRAACGPIGVDLSFGMLAAARTDAPLVHGDALRLPVARRRRSTA